MKPDNTPTLKHLKSKSVIGERRGVSTPNLFFSRVRGGVSIMSVIQYEIVGKCWINFNEYPRKS